MKKYFYIISITILSMGTTVVWAQETTHMQGNMNQNGAEMKYHKDMNGEKMMGMKMCPITKSMAEPKIVATNDGEVVVLIGNKLTKYDKNLNPVKEAEVKIDMAGMQKMMEQMKNMCPMMEPMMKDEHESRADRSDQGY